MLVSRRLARGEATAPPGSLVRMPTRSKWQALPTEAINPATLAIDKLPAAGIVDLMLAEDRKMLAAVQRERDRIALGADMLAKALRKGGRIIFVGAGTSGRLGVLESAEMPPTFGIPTDDGAGDHGRRQRGHPQGDGRIRRRLRGRRAPDPASAADAQGCRGRRVGERHDIVRPRRAHPRARGRRAHHLRHLRSAHRAADVCRSDRSHRRSGPRSSPARPASRRERRPSSCSTC